MDPEHKALEGYKDFLYLVEYKTDQNIIEMIITDEKKRQDGGGVDHDS